MVIDNDIIKQECINIKINIQHLYTIFFPGKENLRTEVGIEPTHSHLWCDALPIELPSLWEQVGGEERYTSAGSWCPLHQKVTFSYGIPLAVSGCSIRESYFLYKIKYLRNEDNFKVSKIIICHTL